MHIFVFWGITMILVFGFEKKGISGYSLWGFSLFYVLTMVPKPALRENARLIIMKEIIDDMHGDISITKIY